MYPITKHGAESPTSQTLLKPAWIITSQTTYRTDHMSAVCSVLRRFAFEYLLPYVSFLSFLLKLHICVHVALCMMHSVWGVSETKEAISSWEIMRAVHSGFKHSVVNTVTVSLQSNMRVLLRDLSSLDERCGKLIYSHVQKLVPSHLILWVLCKDIINITWVKF